MRRARTYPTELYLCTTIVRQDNEGEPVECDVIVYFEARMTSRGWRGSYWEPPEAPEYEVAFSSADLDGESPDAPGPLTEIEIATLRAWFDAQVDRAIECANDNYSPGDVA